MKISDLFEAAESPRETPRKILVVPGFLKKLNRTLRNEASKGINAAFEHFIDCKVNWDPPKLATAKDGPLGYGNTKDLKGVMHTHLVFGKIILIYKVSSTELRLYDIDEHEIVEAGNIAELGRRVKKYDVNDRWEVYTPPAAEQTAEDIPEVYRSIFDEIVQQGRLDLIIKFIEKNDQTVLDRYAEVIKLEFALATQPADVDLDTYTPDINLDEFKKYFTYFANKLKK